MKNLLKLIVLASFILSSCSQNMSITKRKYTKGYYVSHSAKKPHVKGQASNAVVKKQISESEPETIVMQNPVLNDNVSPVITNTEPAGASEPNTTKKIARSKSKSASMKAPFLTRQLDNLIPSKLNKEFKKKQGADPLSEALSLFWIVLLVLLLLYLLGIVFDGFGLGWAIHLFLVIFLICLILWLLRIV